MFLKWHGASFSSSSFCRLFGSSRRVHLESGNCHSPPQPIVRPLKTEVCNFSKTSAKASGAVGLLAYDLFQKDRGETEKLVIMFSVPYDYGTYKNWVAVGLFESGKEVNEALFKEMYYNKEQVNFARAEATGSALIYEGRNLDIMVTMSPLGRSIMKVELWDKLFTPRMSQGPY